MDKSTILATLRKAKPGLKDKYGLTELALFGSFSRNEAKPDSDIDLLVDFSTVTADNFFSCAFALQDLFQNRKVDVVTKNAVKPRYLAAIKPDLIYA